MRTERPLRLNFWMTVCALPALMVLVGLGVWQLQRLEWKENLIAQRSARLEMPAVALAEVPNDGWRAFELRRVSARGRYLHDKTLEIAARTLKGRAGVHIVTPLALDGGGIVLVNRGWAPPAREIRPGEMSRPAGMIEIEGVLRAGGPASPWIPDNEPAKAIWFYADAPAMAVATGLDRVRPFVVELAATPPGAGYPIGGQTVTAIRNTHLQYAVTWFGLAAALVVIYVLYHVRRR